MKSFNGLMDTARGKEPTIVVSLAFPCLVPPRRAGFSLVKETDRCCLKLVTAKQSVIAVSLHAANCGCKSRLSGPSRLSHKRVLHRSIVWLFSRLALCFPQRQLSMSLPVKPERAGIQSSKRLITKPRVSKNFAHSSESLTTVSSEPFAKDFRRLIAT